MNSETLAEAKCKREMIEKVSERHWRECERKRESKEQTYNST